VGRFEKREPVFGGVDTPVRAVGDRAGREDGDRPTGGHEVAPVTRVVVARLGVEQPNTGVTERVRVLNPERREKPAAKRGWVDHTRE
jgi:hypothetical protein